MTDATILADNIERADELLIVSNSGGSGQFQRYERISPDDVAAIIAALRLTSALQAGDSK